jgi:quercetin dioxygenase-like cupin family protein
VRRFIITIALLGAVGGGAGAAALASGGGSITEHVIGAGGIAHPFTFHVRKPGDAVVAKAVVPPGASFGWHYHRANVVAIVQSGTLTLYDGADRSCTPQRIAAGHAFTEHRRHVHLARNETSRRVVVLVTYLGLKHGVNPDVPVPSPGNCPF